MAQNITEQNIAQLTGSGKPLLIDFWATWCGPCKRLAPVIEELAADYEGRAVVGKCDVEENEELAMKYQVTSIPTIVVLDAQGNLSTRLVGVQSKAKLEEELNKVL